MPRGFLFDLALSKINSTQCRLQNTVDLFTIRKASLANPKYYYIETFAVYVVQSTIFLLIAILILPKGSVRDESTFFIMLSILIVLVVMAIFLRRRRLKNDKY